MRTGRAQSIHASATSFEFEREFAKMSIAKKSVLVSYQQRNKVIQIPETKQESDIEFLTKEFKRAFALGEAVDIITFQMFDKEWDEYVDLDDNSPIRDKDKVKVVLTSAVVEETPSTSSASSDIRSIMRVSWLSIIICHFIYLY